VAAKSEAMEADEAAVALNKRFGPGSAYFLGSYQGERLPTIPFGLPSLDAALGGGAPKGRIVEIYGPEASGKTTLLLHLIREAMRIGGKCAFVDAEHALSVDLVENMGIDLNKLMFSQPDSGEQGLDVAIALAKSGAFDVIGVDSVAALVPQAELDGEMDDQQMGLQARMLGKGIRKIAGAASKTDTCVVFINQLRMKIGVMFGNPETTPGGKALGFWASQRIDVRAYKQMKEGKRVIGREGWITVAKNKIAAPYRKIETRLLYGQGFDAGFDRFNFGVETGAIRKKGNTYSVVTSKGAFKLGVGKDAAQQKLRESKLGRKKLRLALKKSVG